MLCNIYNIYRYAFLEMNLKGMKFYEDSIKYKRSMLLGLFG